MKIGVEFSRKGGMQGLLTKYKDEIGRKAERGLVAAAHVLKDASLELVPRDTNELAKSAFIAQKGSGLETVVSVGYGMKGVIGKPVFSPSEDQWVFRVPSDYAMRQHFDHELKHPNGGQADFLGEPMRTKTNEMARAFMEGFKGG